MTHLAYILVVVCAWASSCLGSDNALTASEMPHIVTSQTQRQKAEDHLYDLSERHAPQQEALMSDARTVYRICNSRPQRLAPTSHTAKNQRSAGKFSITFIQHQQAGRPPYGGWVRTLTAPFRPVASRYYYVIALRHILC